MLARWLRRLTGVARGETAPVLLMGSYGFLAMASYYLIKPARNSVFVERVGAGNLPYVYIVTAAVVTVAIYFYSRHVERLDQRRLLLATFGFLTAGLVFFWWLLSRDTSFWSSGAFYVWGKLYPLLLVSQFWLVGNLVFTTRQARRLFAVVGMGLILGGIAGSVLTGALATVLGTEPLLLVAAGVLLACALICSLLFPRIRAATAPGAILSEELSGDAVRLLLRSSHLRTVALILGLTIVVSTLLDWQLNRAVELSVATEDEMTRFWGFFYMAVNVASVTVQAVLTGLVLRRWGVGAAVLVLPVGLLVAAVGVVAAPVLLAVALAKGASDTLRYSLDQSSREVLFLPVSTTTKYKVKPLVDLAVYRGGTGVGGLILLVAVQGLGFGIREVAVLAGGLALLWVAAAIRVRREYVASLVSSMAGPVGADEPADDSRDPGGSAEARRRVWPPPGEADPLRRGFVVEMLGPSEESRRIPVLRRLLLDRSAEPERRMRAAELLGRIASQEAADALGRILVAGAGESGTERSGLRALSRIRRVSGDDVRIDRRTALTAAERQLEAAEAYAAGARNLRAAVGPPIRSDVRPDGVVAATGDGLELLLEALEAERERRREALFHCLALVHPPERVRSAYRAVTDGDDPLRANAMEWLEHTVGRELFARLAPLLEGDASAGRAARRRPDLEASLAALWHDESPEVAALAVWCSARLTPRPRLERRLRILREDSPHAEVRRMAAAVLEGEAGGGGPAGDRPLDPVERAVLVRRGGESERGRR